MTLFDGHLYIPASGVLEKTVQRERLRLLYFRGSVFKVNANTGEVVWKTYMMDETHPWPQRYGVQLYGPAGGRHLDVRRPLILIAAVVRRTVMPMGSAPTNPMQLLHRWVMAKLMGIS